MFGEIALRLTSALLKQHVWNYGDVETIEQDGHTIVCQDGSFLSLIRLEGLRQIAGADEYGEIAKKLRTAIATLMGRRGHSVQFVFERDPSLTMRALNNALRPSVDSAKRLGLDFDDVFKDNVRAMSEFTRWEDCTVAVWTHPFAMPPELIKADQKQHGRIRAGLKALYSDTMNPGAILKSLRDRHAGAVSAFMGAMDDGGMLVRKLTQHQAGAVMARQCDREIADENWKPILPGDKYSPRGPIENMPENDLSGLGIPPLAWQLARRPHERMGPSEVRIGNTYYAPIHIVLFPQEFVLFRRLFGAIPEHIPFRYSVRMGMISKTTLNMKEMLATYTGWLGDGNKRVRASCEHVNEVLGKGEQAVALSATVMTWANSLGELRARAAVVSQAVEGWGICQTASDLADPSESMLSSVCGYSIKSPAPQSYAPVADVVSLLPIDRPGSYWGAGAILFRSPDGKLLPYEPGSSQQSAHVDLIVAGMGSGKSTWLNASTVATCTRSGLDELPYVSTIDIGFSSKGMIELLKMRLPKEKRHLVVHHKLSTNPNESINPFDTQPGARRPTPHERAFMVNFLTLLVTPQSMDTAYTNVAEMSQLVIDQAFQRCTERGYAKVYEPGQDPIVDAKLKELGITTEQTEQWWSVVDKLFEKGEMRLAARAQRYAVPTVSDINALLSDNNTVQSLYGPQSGLQVGSGEQMTAFFGRMLSLAAAQYPILTKPTAIDFSDARIIAVDLNDVARGSEKDTAIFYMLARHITARDYFLDYEHLPVFPPQYQTYQRRRIQAIKNATKRIVFDEFHRTGGIKMIREQVVQDVREGRKWGIQIALSSQRLDDFDRSLIDLATNVFFAGAMTHAAVKEISEKFGLTTTERSMFDGYVHGPAKGGSGMLFRYATKAGWRSQVIRFTKGAKELWAFSTTPADMQLRTRVMELSDSRVALDILSTAFPGGSAESEIERRKLLSQQQGHMGEAAAARVVDKLAEELVLARQRAAAA